MEAQWEAYLAEMATLDQDILAQLTKNRNMLRFAVSRMERLDQPYREEAVPKSGLEEVEEQLVDRRQTQSVMEHTALRIEAEMGHAVEQRRVVEEQFRHAVLTELSACDQQAVTIQQDLSWPRSGGWPGGHSRLPSTACP